MALYTAQIQQLYVAYFNRPADVSGLAYWEAQVVAAGGSTAAISNAFSLSAEYTSLFANKSSVQIVDAIYQNLFGRSAEPAGLLHWSAQLDLGTLKVSDVTAIIANAAQGTDKVAVDNKVIAATNFTDALDTSPEIVGYAANSQDPAVKAWLLGVTDAASLTAAQAALPALVADVVAGADTNPGQTFTLTTGVDQGAAFTGGAGNDTFNAVSSGTANAANTLTAADVLNGGAGTDTLNITVIANDTNTLGSAQITGIETINVRSAVAGQTATVAASSAVGATSVNSNAGAGALTVTALATGAAVGIIGNGTVTNGAVTFDYATATDAVTLNVSGGTKVGTTVANTAATPTTVTINSTGAANTLGIIDFVTGAGTITSLNVNATTDFTATLAADYAVTAALTVTGAGQVNVGAAGTFKTVDASANTGGLTMTIDTVTTSFKGSAANDTITTATLAAPAAGIVDAGAGTGDKLIVAAAGDVASAALRGSYTNFEVLSNATAGGIAADGFTGITSVETAADGAGFTALTAAQAANIKVSASQTAGVTYALTTATGTADVIGLTLGAGTTNLAATNIAGALVVTGFETLNLVANPGPTATVGANKVATIAALTGATLKAVNMTGSAVTITNAATTVAATFDASALTGDGTVAGANGLNIGGSLVAGSTVIGSNFIDTVTVGAIGSTYNTGLGNDSITATQAVILGTTLNAGGGTDTLTLSDVGAAIVVADNSFTNVTGVEKLAFSGATGLTFSVGGYANGIATANAGVLDVTAAALTAATTIDGTGLAAANSMKLTLTNSDALANASATTITLSQGADNITMTQSGALNTDTITINGGVAALAATTAKTIDLSAVTVGGAVAVTTGAGADVIKAAAIAGIYTGGLGADTFTAGAAVDTFVFASNGSVIGTSMDKISSFGTGADILSFTTATVLAADGTATVAGANVQTSAGGLVTFAAADNTLALKIAAVQADAQLDAADSVAIFVDGTNTYVYYAGAAIGNADDQLIELTGVTTLTAITDLGTTITIA